MRSDITKVGPPDKNDRPRKKSGLFEWIWRRSLFAGFFSLGFGGPLAISRTKEMEQRVEAEEQADAEPIILGTACRKQS